MKATATPIHPAPAVGRARRARRPFRGRLSAQDHPRARRTVLAALAIALLGSTACGRKTPPRPPELVMPKTIVGLAAQNNGEGILLSWKRPTDYVDGTRMLDLAGFRVERAAAPDDTFEELSTLEVTDRDRFRQIHSFRYLDQRVTPGASYRYRVTSFTSDGGSSAPSDIVEVRREIPPPTASAH